MAVDGVDVRDAVAVADGSLRGKARERAQARLLATADGRRALEDQQRVVRALRAGGPVASPGLQAALRAHSRQPARTRFGRLGRPALAVGALVAVLAVAVLLAGGPGSAPSVAAALEIGLRPATAPAPTPLAARPALLARSVDGVAFPNWALARQIAPPGMPHTGWKPVGARHDQLAGRSTETVFYTHVNHRVAYTIIAGDTLAPPPHARRITVAGRQLWELRDGRRDVVIFTRHGHTCVLAGHVMSLHTLERLATWHGDGSVTF